MIDLTYMLGSLPVVLAKGEAAGLAFFVIWVIMALVSSAQKKKQKRDSQLPLPQDRTLPREQAALPQHRLASPRSQSRRSAPAMSVPSRIAPARPSPLPPQKLPAAKATRPKLAAKPAEVSAWQPMKDMVQSQWANTTTRSSQMQVMLRRATVRQGIVLAEILRPPLALREEEQAW